VGEVAKQIIVPILVSGARGSSETFTLSLSGATAAPHHRRFGDRTMPPIRRCRPSASAASKCPTPWPVSRP